MGGCCYLLFRPRDPERAIEASREFQSRWEDRFQGLDSDQVEAFAIEIVGGTVELGLVLGPIQTQTDSSGRTHFEASLANVAELPVARPRVILRLKDEGGQLVEVITLGGTLATLQPGGVERVAAEFDPASTPPRILEETISLSPSGSTFFSVLSHEEVKLEPGFLPRLADLVPLFHYDIKWTDPTAQWVSYEIEFRIDKVIGD
jgi:hypothetical protein